ncbi:MAG: EAL domain-containing protein [Gammaproteobacteria bacterium]|nr:MAG: EAL domain-containing protein [Gammaproteobacteria bacterium]
MKPIRTAPLKFTLPALVSTVALAGILLLTGWQYRSQVELLEEGIRHELILDISRIQGHVERELQRDDLEEVRREFTSFSVRPQVALMTLSDDAGRILVSSRLALEGRELAAVATRYDAMLYRRALRERRLLLRSDLLHDGHIQLYAPVSLPAVPGRLRTDRRGMIYVDFDYGRDLATLAARLRTQALQLLGGTIAAVLLLVIALHFLVTLPVTHLRAVANRIAGGDLEARPVIEGSGELHELAQDLIHMTERIADTLGRFAESNEQLASTLRSIGDGVIVTDTGGHVTRINPCAERLTGWSEQEARGRHLLEVFHIVHAETRRPAENPVERVLREGGVVGLANHTALIARDGREYLIADSAAPIHLPDGELLGVILVFQDVTEQYRMRRELERHHEELRNFASALPGVAFILDESGTCLEVFGSQHALLAFPPEQMRGRRVPELLPALAGPLMETITRTLSSGEPQRLEYQLELTGGARWFEGRTAVLRRGKGLQGQVAWLALDITERKATEAHVERLAYYDPLTALPNRRLFMERLQHELALARRSRLIGALLFLDLDYFKTLNDALGHEVGDLLLKEVAARLSGCLREEDTVARLGGDEFTIILPNLGSTMDEAATDVGTVAAKLREAINRPYELNGHQYLTTISLGITLFPSGTESAEDLLRQADAAMYLSKSAGRNTISFYRPELQQAAEARLQLENDLRRAMEEEAFELHYQPQCNREGHVIGLEALIRWNDPKRGPVPPSVFIPVMEENGGIVELGKWVLRRALRDYRRWQEGCAEPPLSISVNISTRQFRVSGLVGQVRALLEETGVPGSALVLELTEGVLLDNFSATVRRMNRLRELGVRFSIDDFGTGYSSLGYLRRLPLDELKIDRSFVGDVDHDADAAAIVETIIAMAEHLGMEVVAEGVETKAQLDFLIRNGCRRFQGWYFSRAMDAEGIAALLGRAEALPLVQP